MLFMSKMGPSWLATVEICYLWRNCCKFRRFSGLCGDELKSCFKKLVLFFSSLQHVLVEYMLHINFYLCQHATFLGLVYTCHLRCFG